MMSFLLDHLIDTGGWKLTLGRTPGGRVLQSPEVDTFSKSPKSWITKRDSAGDDGITVDEAEAGWERETWDRRGSSGSSGF